MGLYRLQGRLSQLGQCEFDNEAIVYAFAEIIHQDGQRTLVKKVAVFTDVSSALSEGVEGDFYFDDLFVFGRNVRCQLWGFATTQRMITDSVNLRNRVTRGNLIFGVLFTPVLALGSTHLVAGLGQLLFFLTGATSRRRFLHRLEAGDGTSAMDPAHRVASSAAPRTLGSLVSRRDDMMRR